MFIRTERLFLRPAWPEDAAELHAAIAHEGVVQHLARAPWPYSLEDAEDFAARPSERRLPSLLITQPSASGSRVIGGIGLHDDEGAPALGYWLTPDAWGRGFATESARAVLRLARTLGHRQIGARHFVDNPGSGRVLDKLGFEPSGVIEPRFSLGRGGLAPSRSYLLRFDRSGDCDREPAADEPYEAKMCAA